MITNYVLTYANSLKKLVVWKNYIEQRLRTLVILKNHYKLTHVFIMMQKLNLPIIIKKRKKYKNK